MNAELPAPPPLTTDVALFLDFDGTLVDIAPHPADVHIPATLIRDLDQAAVLLNGALAVVSGRPLAVIDAYLGGSVRCVAGLHGAERRDALGHTQRTAPGSDLLDSFRATLGVFCAAHPGVFLEDKGAALALHFRSDASLGDACRQAIDVCVAAGHGLFTRLDGKMVAELKPAGITKISAVDAYMNEAPFASRRPVFVGDDVTDEIAFAHLSKTNGFGVKVGDGEPTAATARLPSVAALHRWLRAFCDGNDDRTYA